MKLVFSFVLVYFSVMGWSVNTWVSLWMLMEISFLVFMGFLAFEASYGISELMMKYFIVQVLAGVSILICLMLGSLTTSVLVELGIFFGLSTKLGLAPFHFWMISILGKMSWAAAVFLFSFMKLLPLLLVGLAVDSLWLMPVLWISAVVGSLGGVGNSAVQKVVGYSGMINTSWVVYSLGVGVSFFFFFWLGYLVTLVLTCYIFSLMNVFYLNQFKFVSFSISLKFWLFFICLSFSGVPPFLGFLMKLSLAFNVSCFSSLFTLVVLVMFSLISFVYYLQVWFYFMLVYFCQFKWYNFVLGVTWWLELAILFFMGMAFILFVV